MIMTNNDTKRRRSKTSTVTSKKIKIKLSIKRDRVAKNSTVKCAQAWAVQGWVTSWKEEHWGGEEL